MHIEIVLHGNKYKNVLKRLLKKIMPWLSAEDFCKAM